MPLKVVLIPDFGTESRSALEVNGLEVHFVESFTAVRESFSFDIIFKSFSWSLAFFCLGSELVFMRFRFTYSDKRNLRGIFKSETKKKLRVGHICFDF